MKKILVVDDEDNIRLLYQEELRDAGYEVSLAENAEEALKKIEEDPPDLITSGCQIARHERLRFSQGTQAKPKRYSGHLVFGLWECTNRNSNSGLLRPM